MGKRGLGRKAFVKAAMAQPSGRGEEQETDEDSSPAQVAEDVTTAAEAEQPEQRLEAPQQPLSAADLSAAPPPPDAPGDETRGQALQRHKRELKAHKELAKRMGKKRKDEATALESALEERQALELAALDARDEQKAQDTPSVSVLADGLSSCRLGSDDVKPASKQTRAQKRRGARAAEEAERDARIAEEQASLGESDRAAEARELQALLDPLGLAVRDIPADGNCLYRAVEDQLLQCGAASEAAGGYPALRARVAAHMREHAADYTPFVLPEEADGGDSASEVYEQYCRAVAETAAWGGQVELGALAALLQRRITVYSVGMPAVDMGPDAPGPQEVLRLCYLRHAFGLGEHYNSVERKALEAAKAL